MSFVALRAGTAAVIATVETEEENTRSVFTTTRSDALCKIESVVVADNFERRADSDAGRRLNHAGRVETNLSLDSPIVVIEPRSFLRECIRRGMQANLPYAFYTVGSVDEFERNPQASLAQMIILSCSGTDDLNKGAERASLERLSALFPSVPVVVLASRQDPELIHVAFDAGAKGYIPMSMGFDLAVEAVRFVLAGGTYVPAEFLINSPSPSSVPARAPQTAMTAREMLVARAIQQGKPNKIIAYELNMCESTVKVHVRHIMKKLGAKNRTAVAMKSNELLGAPAETRYR